MDSINNASAIDKSQAADRVLAEDHAELDELLRALLASLNAGDATQAFAHLDLFWARLAMHIRAENLHLFPAILNALESDSKQQGNVTLSLEEASEAIARLRSDHEFFMHELAGMVKTMREARAEDRSQETTDQLSSVRQRIVSVGNRLAKHNELEEVFVYRWPKMLLDTSGQTRLAEQIVEEIENLPSRFKTSVGGSSVLDVHEENVDS